MIWGHACQQSALAEEALNVLQLARRGLALSQLLRHKLAADRAVAAFAAAPVQCAGTAMHCLMELLLQ